MALRGILKKVFTFETLVGDIRSAVIGSITGVVAAFFGSIIFANTLLDYTVFVNDDGYGQPRGLFEYAEKRDPKLKLKFNPEALKNVFVCEYKLVTAANWRQVVLSYLDSYRDCFDVTARDENSFIISPNFRTSLMKKNDSIYTCKCNG